MRIAILNLEATIAIVYCAQLQYPKFKDTKINCIIRLQFCFSLRIKINGEYNYCVSMEQYSGID